MLAFQGSWLLLVYPFFCSGGKKGENNKTVLTFLEISRLGLFPAQTQAARRSRGAVCPMSRIWRDWWPERPHDDDFDHHSDNYFTHRNDTGKEVSCIATNTEGSAEAKYIIDVACKIIILLHLSQHQNHCQTYCS